MKIRHKNINICIVSIITIILFLGLSLNSCRAKSPSDEGSVAKESGSISEEEENNIKPAEGKGSDTGQNDSGQKELGSGEDEEVKGIEKELPVDSSKIAQENENIRVTSPLQNQVVSSPLVITGEARGTWFFEACFPVKILDGNGEEIAAHYATALSDWMTEDFVPFEATIEFEEPDTEIGFLVLKKDNPTGLPEFDDELVIAVRFE
jgi:hypothetical protein